MCVQIIFEKNNTKTILPYATLKNNYVINRHTNTPIWINDELYKDNINKDDLIDVKFDELTKEQLKYVWQINKEVDGCKFITGKKLYDEKTKNYIEKTKENIKLVEISYKDKPRGYIEKSRLDYKNELDIVKLEKENHIYTALQYCVQASADDFITVTYILNSTDMKNIENILEICKTIRKIEEEIRFPQIWSDTFECYSCGNKVHWVDIDEKGIVEKYRCKKEHYCGC